MPLARAEVAPRDRRRARHHAGLRPLPHARYPAAVNRLIGDFFDRRLGSRAGAGAPPRRLEARQAGALPVLADRPRPCPPRPADRARAAPPASRPAGRLAGAGPGDALLAGPASDPPGERAARQRSAHIEAEAGEHDLHAFQALRRMDEILIENFMVFQDALERGATTS